MRLDGTHEKQSNEEQHQGNKIFLCIIGLFLMTGLIYLLGKFFQVWTEQGTILPQDMQVQQQYIAALGKVERVIPCSEQVYFVDASGNGWRMARELPSWVNVEPEKITQDGEQLATVQKDGTRGLFRQGNTWYLKHFTSGEQQVIRLPEGISASALVRADFSFAGTELLAEIKTQAATELWQWTEASGQWERITEGEQGSYRKYGEQIYFAHDGQMRCLQLAKRDMTVLTAGNHPAISDYAGYLAYTAPNPSTGVEEVWICLAEKPEEAFQLTHYGETGIQPGVYTDIVWEMEQAGLYITRKKPDGQHEVKYYAIANKGAEVSVQVSTFFEACLMDNAETAEVLWAGEQASEEMQRFCRYGLGFYAEEKNNGWSESGMYQNGDCQLYDSTAAMPYESWDGKLFLHAAREGYELERYQERILTAYGMKDGYFYKKDENGVIQAVSTQSFANIVACGFNQTHDNWNLLQKTPTGYQCIIFNANGSYWEIPLALPENAQAYQMSFSQTGHVGAVYYRVGEQQGIAVLNLKKHEQIDSVFLSDVEKVFWSSNHLIVYSGTEELQVRWVYAPSEGTLTLQ